MDGALAKTDDARLLWYCVQAHGTGPAYKVVTITAVRDGVAWETLARRVQSGDLQIVGPPHSTSCVTGSMPRCFCRSVGRPCRSSSSPRYPPTVRLTSRASTWKTQDGPNAALDDYIDFWESGYFEPMRTEAGRCSTSRRCSSRHSDRGGAKKRFSCSGSPTTGRLMHLLTTEISPELRAPGQFMHEALSYRDQWESRLLRTSAWSPLY